MTINIITKNLGKFPAAPTAFSRFEIAEKLWKVLETLDEKTGYLVAATVYHHNALR